MLVYLFAVLVASLLPFLVEPVKHSSKYSTSWAVEIEGGSREADRLASRHGFINRGQVTVGFLVSFVAYSGA